MELLGGPYAIITLEKSVLGMTFLFEERSAGSLHGLRFEIGNVMPPPLIKTLGLASSFSNLRKGG